MANPYDKFLNTEDLQQKSVNDNPYDQFLNADERSNRF